MQNRNYLTNNDYFYQCGYKTNWAHSRYGEIGSGLVGKVMNKPGCRR